jgi:predicted secreted protein
MHTAAVCTAAVQTKQLEGTVSGNIMKSQPQKPTQRIIYITLVLHSLICYGWYRWDRHPRGCPFRLRCVCVRVPRQ